MIVRLPHWRAALALAAFALATWAPSRVVGDEPSRPTTADEPSGSVDLDEIVVRVAPDREGASPAAAAPGAAATVVDATQFAGEVRSVGELVGTAPGVTVREQGGLGQLTTVSVRGSSADGVLVLLDGLPLNTAFGGGVNLSTIPRQWISAIEVLRGAEGARLGAGAMGGAVNIITRRSGSGAWNAQATTGSLGTWSTGADAAFGGERWGALVAAGWDRTGGRFAYDYDPLPAVAGNPIEHRRRENDAAWSAGVLAKGFATVAGGRWDLLAQASGGEHELPGNPQALTPTDRQQDRRVVARLRHARLVAGGLRVSAEIAGRDERLATRLEAAGGEADQRDRAASARVAVVMERRTASAEVAVGAGLEHLLADGLRKGRNRPELDASASGELRLASEQVRIGPAFRVQRVGAFDGWSAKLGTSWRVVSWAALRASGGRTFRAPSFAELYLEQAVLAPNPDLSPEQAWSGDGALELRGAAGLLSAGAFVSLYDDLIVYQPAAFQRYRPFNSGRSRIAGIELELASSPWGPAALVASAAYTWMRTALLRGEEGVLGNEVPHRPEHRIFARIAGSRGALAAHADIEWTAAQWADTRNQDRIPEAASLGAGASVLVVRRPALRVQVEARNVLDRRDLQDGFGNPLPGRMILVGLRAGSTPQPGYP